MFWNYIKVGLRNMWKRKRFSLINIFGLAVAIAGSVLLSLTALYEYSFDRFHKDSDRVYRVFYENKTSRGLEKTANAQAPLGPALEEEVRDLEAITRWAGSSGVVRYGEKLMKSSIRYTDPDFFKIFSFRLIQGDPESALSDINSIILSERTAARIFGTEDPMGKTLEINVLGNAQKWVVSGIIESTPDNSSLEYGIITRIENAPGYSENIDAWNNSFLYVFAKASPKATVSGLENQSRVVVSKYLKEEEAQLRRDGATGEVIKLRFQPLHDLHFDTKVSDRGLARAFPFALLTIAIFILSIACINFVNLSLGIAVTRAKEVGVRKVVGASRRQIITQFWGEALLLVGMAVLAGLALAQVLLPHYNNLFRLSISLYNTRLLLVLGGILVLVGLLGGAYPALALSRFQPSAVLKGITKMQKPGRLRNALVIVQFAFSTLLIICTLIVARQIDYLRTKPLGFNKEQVVSIPMGDELDSDRVIEELRIAWESNPKIKYVSGSYGNLGIGEDGSSRRSVITFEQEEQTFATHWNPVDYDYIEALEIPVIEGRSFSRDISTDSIDAIIINEKLAVQLGRDSALGRILHTQPRRKVIGIMENYHFEPLSNTIEPLSLVLGSANGFRFNYIFVRIQSDQVLATINEMQKTWKARYPQSAFNYSFLDENNDRLYRAEQRMGQIFMSAAILAIALSCMGLFGIAMLVIAQRTKEIGVRKVIGASVTSLMLLVSKDFLRLVILAFVIAAPLAWLAMDLWLNQYAYRREAEWWIFALAGVLSCLIAMLTLSLHAYKAANADPVRSLRME